MPSSARNNTSGLRHLSPRNEEPEETEITEVGKGFPSIDLIVLASFPSLCFLCGLLFNSRRRVLTPIPSPPRNNSSGSFQIEGGVPRNHGPLPFALGAAPG